MDFPDASAESDLARCHLAIASVVERHVAVFEIRSLPLTRSTQVISWVEGAALAGIKFTTAKESTQVASTTFTFPILKCLNTSTHFYSNSSRAELWLRANHFERIK